MGGYTERFRQWWVAADRSQRAMTLGGLALLVFLFVGAFMVATKPKYETLYANLSEQEQSAVVTDLQSLGFDVKFDRAGTVEVPAADKAAARVKLAAANKLPKAQGQWGLTELNSSPFGMTPQVEQMRLKAIEEGEIARSLEGMEGVASARVHLTIPERSAFTQEQRPASASVSIVEGGNATLGPTQGRAIAMLVRNAVDGLDTKDIVVENQHMQMIWNGEDEQSEGLGGAVRKTDIENTVSKNREREIQQLLDTAFGSGATVVTVHADVDMDPSKTVAIERTPSKAASAIQTSTEDVKGNAPAIGGIGGLRGQGAPTAGGVPGSNAGNYVGKSATKEFLASEVQTESTHAIGSIKGMAINVMVDTGHPGADPKAVEKALYGDLGNKIQFDKSGVPLPNQAYTVKVTPVDFDKTAAKEAVTMASSAAGQQRMQQLMAMLPIAALLIVAGLVLKQVLKFAKTQVAVAPLSLATERVALPAAQRQVPTLPDAELHSLLAQIENNQSDPERRERKDDEIDIEVEDIKNRVHIPLEQLKKMAHERPAIVSQLIKSMLLEERK